MIIADTPAQRRKRARALARARKDLARFHAVNARADVSELDRALCRLVIEQLEAAIPEPYRLVRSVAVGVNGVAGGYF